MTKEKFMAKIQRKQLSILEAISHIQKSGEMLNDFVVPSTEIAFDQVYDQTGEALEVEMVFGGNNMKLHRNAVSQLAGRMGVSARDLQNEINGPEWKKGVFINRLNEYTKNNKSKFLVRKVDDTAKAILSDRYKRMNTAAIFLAFLESAQRHGAVLVGANNGELKDYLEVVHPEIIEVPTEKNGIIYMVYGAQIRNSDFGASPLDLRLYGENTVCLNGMTSKTMMNQRHLGQRMEASDTTNFTVETIEAETKARALAVRDIMDGVYSPENLTRERQRVVEMSDIELDFTAKIKELPKLGMTEAETDSLTKVLMANDPSDGVQGANTLWKLAQGMTAVANKSGSEDRKRDLQDIASSMVSGYVK